MPKADKERTQEGIKYRIGWGFRPNDPQEESMRTIEGIKQDWRRLKNWYGLKFLRWKKSHDSLEFHNDGTIECHICGVRRATANWTFFCIPLTPKKRRKR